MRLERSQMKKYDKLLEKAIMKSQRLKKRAVGALLSAECKLPTQAQQVKELMILN